MNELEWVYKHEPSYNLKDFIGIDHIIKIIKSRIVDPINSPLKNIGSYDKTIGNILSVGPRGTLKHELSEAIAEEIHAMYYDIELDEISSTQIEEDINALFSDISCYEHAVIYCELPEIGNALDGVIKAQREYHNAHGNDSVIIMACSDEPLDIYSKYLGKDYFRYLINHSLPDFETRKKLLFFGEFDESDYEKNFPFNRLAEMTERYSY